MTTLSIKNGPRLAAILLSLAGALAACKTIPSYSPDPDPAMPRPRDVGAAEKEQLEKRISRSFHRVLPPEATVRAAGPFRFVTSKDFIYIDRTDVGSFSLEATRYGTSAEPLDPAANRNEALLAQIEQRLREIGPDVAGRRFTAFNDEFVGAVQPQGLPRDFDPRKQSRLVARTATFDRFVEQLPVFGSELQIGLQPDGEIGRFRLHWPRLEESQVREAQKLVEAVQSGAWRPPEDLRAKGAEILELRGGIAHSAFVDPGFRSKPVVRVLFRRTTPGLAQPLASTGYKYFDEAGREVVLSIFPAGTPSTANEKPGNRKE